MPVKNTTRLLTILVAFGQLPNFVYAVSREPVQENSADTSDQINLSKPEIDQDQREKNRRELTTQLSNKINFQVDSFRECQKTDAHRLSDVVRFILYFKDQTNKTAAAQKKLYEMYKSLGGIADTADNVQKMPDPCDSIANEIRNVKAQQKQIQNAKDPAYVTGKFHFEPSCYPLYPRLSLANQESGKVRVSILINAEGQNPFVLLSKSSGSPLLDDSALKSLAKCTCEPSTYKGVPEQSWFDVDYVFELKN